MESYELTNPQKSIWFTEEFYKGTAINNICGNLIIKEKVEFDKLIEAINLFVKTNDSFRLKFFADGTMPKQYLSDFKSFDIEIVDVNSEEEVLNLQKEMVNIPFEVKDSLLFNFKVVRFSNEMGGFVVCTHHLVSDAATFAILAKNIVEIYSSLIKSEEINYNINSYIDYINSEQEYLKKEKFNKDKTYWNSLYEDVPELATIPSLVKEYDKNSFNALREEIVLPKGLMEKINLFCKENKVTPFNLFMALYALYLARVSSLDDVVIGTPILNRTNFIEKNTSGMFINTAAFRISINHSQTFTDFISKISIDSLSMLRHQKYPYQQLIEDLRKNGNNIPSLYDFMFSYQVTKATDKELDIPYTTHWVGNNQIANSIEVHAHDNDNNGTLSIAYDYKVSKYTKEDIINLHNRILCMLNQIIEKPEVLLKDIEIITPEEKHKILYEFNNIKIDYPKDKTITQLFEEQVEKTPNNIAVVFGDEKLTYKELNEKANRLANYLRANNVNENSIVSVCMNKNIDFVVSILGIQKAGGAYLPIHPDYPEERISYILENSKSKLLISDKEVSASCVKFSDIDLSAYSSKNLDANINSESLAYIIYTSGSTGNPKGVKVKHSNLINFIYSFNNKFNNKFSAQDNCLSLTNISFDVSVCELFTPLVMGSTLVLYTENTLTNIPMLVKTLTKEKITFLYIPPNVLLEVYKYIKEMKSDIYINKLLVGVEAITNDTLNKYLELNPNMEIINGYGPTETTICATFYKFKRNEDLYSNVPIGVALDNNSVLVLDKNMNIQPIGALGEIYVKGENVTSGYLFNSELTNKLFVKYGDEILYKTGDMAFCNIDGNISFVGRNDSQIKFRGHRIELGEITNTIKKLSYVENAYTLVKEVNNIPSICSYIIASEEMDLINTIKSELKKQLPYYMLPSHIVVLEKFPLTANGKIDKSKLPNINISKDKKNNLPRTETENKLYHIWENILNISDISTDDDFFELGADSLCSIKLIAEISKEFNLKIKINDVFVNSTMANLAKFIDNSNKDVRISRILKTAESEYYPTSSAQKRVYYSCKLDDSGITYNMPGGLILSKMPNIEKLEKCFNKIIDRHETLRTYFEVVNGELIQKIKDDIRFRLETSNEIISRAALNNEFINFVKPFDLSKAPLIRAKIVKLEDNRALLLFDMHHIISDGTSMQILINELCSLYNGNELEPVEIAYKDYAIWEQGNVAKDKLKKSEEFWINQFKDEIPVLDMPTNYSRPSTKSFEGDSIYKNIDKELTAKIIHLSKELNITPYMFLLSCYYILLYKYTSQKNIVVGTPVVGRDNSQIDNIIGMFVNSLPLRKKIDSNDSFYEFSIMVKELCLNAFQHQTYPFDELVNKLKVKRDTSRNPLFDTMFIYQNNGNVKVNLGDIESEYYIPDSNISKFDLSLEIIPEEDNGLNLRFEYATKLFDKEFIEYLAKHYINIVKTVMENRSIKIADIDMLTKEEKQKILYKFNNTKVDLQDNKTIIQIFEEQVKKNPKNIAVIFDNEELTYEELNERANRFARYLIKMGTKPNDIIGILLPRSLELIISIWAILKAGAAYMLINHNLPNERIKYMLKNANAHMLLTNQGLKNVKYNPTLYVNNLELDQENGNNVNLKLSNENNLAVIYTSGSTGEPKGVLLKQGGLVNLLNAFIKEMKIDTFKTFLSIASISFDMFTVESMISILLGKTLILSNEEEQKDPCKLGILGRKYSIDFLITTPSRMEIFLSQEDSKNLVSSLKGFQLGGEVFSPNLYEKLIKATKAKIYNGYGPTEITACCSNKEITNPANITIGKPLMNTSILILDKDMNLCPINVPGELCVSGLGVSKGYINNEEATQKAFVNDKYTNSTLYKTGDIAKYNENGELIYLGRNDSQIKIRGLRIELSEIENKILDIEKIQKCAVLYKKDAKNPYIIAFFTANKNLEITDIRKELSKVLPSYMIPKYIMQIDDMPITTNGKINTKELYDIPIDIKEDNYVAPNTEKQKLFCKVLGELLNVQVGITDDIFELGVDSLIAIKFKVELMSHNIDIPYADIFKYHTVKELCESKPVKMEVTSLDKYNYDAINLSLSKNVFKEDIDIINNKKNNVLLLGATGYVGMHIINSFIEKDKGIIYCIVRDKNNKSARSRFIETLHFYFGKKLDKYIDKRIRILKGDLLKENFNLSGANIKNVKEKISIIINSAANVKHYGSAEKFNNINVGVTQNLVKFCIQHDKRLIHISSLSVSGNMVLDGTPNKEMLKEKLDFLEKNLYIGQMLDNVYTRSKFEAERLILDNISTGLNAQILRLGNITNRYSDGKFQINPKDNAFLTRIRSIINIGAIPDYLLNGYIEFTPVDACADAILLIMQNYVKDCSVLHVYDYNHIYINSLLKILKNLNINIEILDDSQFARLLTKLLKDSVKKKYVSGIINDLSPDKKLNYEGNVKIKSTFSVQYLSKIGFNWPIIDEKYIIKYIKYMRKNKFI